MFRVKKILTAGLLGVSLLAGSAHGITLLNTFSPGGTLNAIGFDTSSDLLYIHANFGADILEYDTSGNLLGTIPHPGSSTNDSDLSVSQFATNVNGFPTPAGTLMVTNGETDPQTLYAVDILSGTVLDSIALAEPIGQLTGGAIGSGGELVGMDWSNDVIRFFDPSDGSQTNSFGFGGGWTAFYSDVEVAPNGNLVLVSSNQAVIRIMSPGGAVLQNYDVSSLGISGMSGLALDYETQEAFISSTNGNVYHIDGLDAVPEPQTYALLGLGAVMIGVYFWRRRQK